MTTRRDLLKGFFSGVVLLGTVGSASAAIHVYHRHDYYVAPGKWNIWYVHQEEWHLLSNISERPFEFDSKEDAQKYIQRTGLKNYSPRFIQGGELVRDSMGEYYKQIPNPNRGSLEGTVIVRKAPINVHNFLYMRLSESEAESFIKIVAQQAPVTPRAANLMKQMLMAEDGAQQCRIWIHGLNTIKKELVVLQGTAFKGVVKEIYLTSSYHATKALLEAFNPPHLRWG